jgi:hypothetical protein
MDYKNLMKFLNEFETALGNAKLKTDEVADLVDKVMWLEEKLSEMDSDDD